MTHSPALSRVGDWSAVALLAVGSLGLGWLGNLFRAEPLPLIYRDKEQRLARLLPIREAVRAPALALPDELSLAAFQTIVQGGRQLILDARPTIFYRLGHVPGALSLPRDDFAAAYAQLKAQVESSRREPMVVYCSDESCEDSRLVQAALAQLGYPHVAIFTGGWSEWQHAGLPKAVSSP